MADTHPSHLLWGGTEAGYALFLASGLVLALPMQDTMHSARAWTAYYPRRLVRLYLPVAGSVLLALALALAAAVPRREQPGFSWWLNGHAEPVTVGGVLRDLVLVTGNTWLNSPLWSTRLTVVFAVTLPLHLLAVRLFDRRGAWGCVVVLATVTAASLLAIETVVLLGVFAVGALAARHLPQVVQSTSRLGRRGWVALGAVTIGCSEVRWIWATLPLQHLSTLAGACLVVLGFLACPWVIRLGGRPALQFLGRTSSSLYLVHVPVVVSIANPAAPLGAGTALAITLVLGVPTSILVAGALHRWYEAPLHGVSRRAGDAVGHGHDRASSRLGRASDRWRAARVEAARPAPDPSVAA